MITDLHYHNKKGGITHLVVKDVKSYPFEYFSCYEEWVRTTVSDMLENVSDMSDKDKRYIVCNENGLLYAGNWADDININKWIDSLPVPEDFEQLKLDLNPF